MSPSSSLSPFPSLLLSRVCVCVGAFVLVILMRYYALTISSARYAQTLLWYSKDTPLNAIRQPEAYIGMAMKQTPHYCCLGKSSPSLYCGYLFLVNKGNLLPTLLVPKLSETKTYHEAYIAWSLTPPTVGPGYSATREIYRKI